MRQVGVSDHAGFGLLYPLVIESLKPIGILAVGILDEFYRWVADAEVVLIVFENDFLIGRKYPFRFSHQWETVDMGIWLEISLGDFERIEPVETVDSAEQKSPVRCRQAGGIGKLVALQIIIPIVIHDLIRIRVQAG